MEIVNSLRKKIIAHELLPDSKLRENDLAQQFKVSRPRIREAFVILEQRGLINRIPNQGAVVARPNFESLMELFEVREVLESLAAQLATEKTASSDWDDLAAAFASVNEEQLEKGALEKYVAIIDQFRSRTMTAAKNQTLTDLFSVIYDKTRLISHRTIALPGRAIVSLRQQREILHAIRSGNADKAEKLKRQSVRSARDALTKYKSFIS